MSQEEKPKTRNQSYRERMVLLLRDIKMKSGCVICGYKEHWAALDFHHRDPTTKLFNICLTNRNKFNNNIMHIFIF